MSVEDDAKKLMKALVARGHEVGVPINNSHLQQIATEIGIDGHAQDEAIVHAAKANWISHGVRQGTVDLTQAGWESGNA